MSVHFSSKTDLWSTPQAFYDSLHEEFNFTLDPCATHDNHKTDKYFTIDDDGLTQDWSNDVVFMNPPYGRVIGDWVKKASESETTVVCLVPARTDTRWWHDYVIDNADEIRFIKGRLKFGGQKNSAPFPSAVVIFRNKKEAVDPTAQLIYEAMQQGTLERMAKEKTS
jgi:site-specific DNA-methyltransferase (adenine-specific)